MDRHKFLKKFGSTLIAPTLIKLWVNEYNTTIENNTTTSYWKKSIERKWQHLAVVKQKNKETYYLNGIEDPRAKSLYYS